MKEVKQIKTGHQDVTLGKQDILKDILISMNLVLEMQMLNQFASQVFIHSSIINLSQ